MKNTSIARNILISISCVVVISASYITREKPVEHTDDLPIIENIEPIEDDGETVKINATAYCNCYYCTQSGKGITASGTTAKIGTIAAPQNVPFGSTIEFGGVEYIVEDRGGAIVNNGDTMHIDIWFPSHDEALEYGRKLGNGTLVTLD